MLQLRPDEAKNKLANSLKGVLGEQNICDNICDSISYNMKIKRWIDGVKSCCPTLTSAAHCEPTHAQGP